MDVAPQRRDAVDVGVAVGVDTASCPRRARSPAAPRRDSIHPCCWVNGCQTCRRSASISAVVRSTARHASADRAARALAACRAMPTVPPLPAAAEARARARARDAAPARLAAGAARGGRRRRGRSGRRCSPAAAAPAPAPQRAARVDLPGRRPPASTAPRRWSARRSTSCGRSGSTASGVTVAVGSDRARSRRRPARPAHFDARDPAAYPPAAGSPYDRVVEPRRASAGSASTSTSTAPGPLWAMAPRGPDAEDANHFAPDPAAFGDFVTAVGRRYDGGYTVRAGGGQ